jgi:hypothetical protein
MEFSLEKIRHTTTRKAINHEEKYLLLRWKCSRLNKSVMSFNDDDKDKNVVSSFFTPPSALRARKERRNNEAIYIKLTYR